MPVSLMPISLIPRFLSAGAMKGTPVSLIALRLAKGASERGAAEALAFGGRRRGRVGRGEAVRGAPTEARRLEVCRAPSGACRGCAC